MGQSTPSLAVRRRGRGYGCGTSRVQGTLSRPDLQRGGGLPKLGNLAAVLRATRPGLSVSVEDAVDPVLADIAEDYDASELVGATGYTMRWSLERAVPNALANYSEMFKRSPG